MKAVTVSELRIGNLLQYDGDGTVIVDICDLEDIRNEVGSYSPIPLSPSILERCGFVKEDYIVFRKYTIGHFKILDNEGVFMWKVSELPAVEVYSLHQLQNLFYSATHQELKINL